MGRKSKAVQERARLEADGLPAPKPKPYGRKQPSAAEQRLGRVLRRSLLILNAISLLPLLLLALAPHVPPTTWALPTLAGMMAPYCFIPALVWLVIWPFVRWPWALANLAAILLHIPTLLHLYGWSGPAAQRDDEIRILSWNTASLAYKKERIPLMAAHIAAQEPDIVCLQEFYNFEGYGVQVAIDQLKDATGLEYHYFEQLLRGYGLLVLSRYPISESRLLNPPPEPGQRNTNGLQYCTLQLYDQRLGLYNVHLQSFTIGGDAAVLLRDLRGAPWNLGTVYELVEVMHPAWQQQTEQISRLEEHRALREHPVLVAGDLNMTAFSRGYRRMRGSLQDSYRSRGSGRGTTYGTGGLRWRIDYIMPPRELRIQSHEVLPATVTTPQGEELRLSDHNPVLSRLRYRHLR